MRDDTIGLLRNLQRIWRQEHPEYSGLADTVANIEWHVEAFACRDSAAAAVAADIREHAREAAECSGLPLHRVMLVVNVMLRALAFGDDHGTRHDSVDVQFVEAA